MYGILFFIISSITRFGANIILLIQDALSRNNSAIKGKSTYADHNGASRLTSTGQRFSAGENTDGHWVWTDDNLNIIKDVSQEIIDKKRKENYDFAIKHGHSVYLWMSPKWGQITADGYKKIYNKYLGYFKNPNELNIKHLPRLYKDVKTGEIYVVKELCPYWYQLINEITGLNIKFKRELNDRYFVNPKTNEVVKPLDDVCLNKNRNENLTQDDINIINKLTRENNKNFFKIYDAFEDDIYWKERKQ